MLFTSCIPEQEINTIRQNVDPEQAGLKVEFSKIDHIIFLTRWLIFISTSVSDYTAVLKL